MISVPANAFARILGDEPRDAAAHRQAHEVEAGRRAAAKAGDLVRGKSGEFVGELKTTARRDGRRRDRRWHRQSLWPSAYSPITSSSAVSLVP